jgi:hypothetical protein
MKTTIVNAVLAGFIGVAAAGLVGCADTADTTYDPPVTARETTTTQQYTTMQPATQVINVPTTVTTMVPVTANATTTTTHFNNGTVEKRTSTDYNPTYTATGAPYATSVVTSPAMVAVAPVEMAPATSTTRTTTTSDDDGNTTVEKRTTTVTSPSY